MKYRFETHKYIDPQDSKPKESPIIVLENQEDYGFFFLDEIMNLDSGYLETIISKIRDIIANDTAAFSFGYELYSIDCKSKFSKVIDTGNNWKTVAEIPTIELLRFLSEWKTFKDKFTSGN